MSKFRTYALLHEIDKEKIDSINKKNIYKVILEMTDFNVTNDNIVANLLGIPIKFEDLGEILPIYNKDKTKDSIILMSNIILKSIKIVKKRYQEKKLLDFEKLTDILINNYSNNVELLTTTSEKFKFTINPKHFLSIKIPVLLMKTELAFIWIHKCIKILDILQDENIKYSIRYSTSFPNIKNIKNINSTHTINKKRVYTGRFSVNLRADDNKMLTIH